MPPLPARAELRPFWSHPRGLKFYQGDVREVLAKLPAGSVHCVTTSPPYWGLRDYGTARWEGGDPGCDHLMPRSFAKSTLKNDGRPQEQVGWNTADHGKHRDQYKGSCRKCGAVRIDNQLGAEPSPDCGSRGQAQCGACFVCNLVGVFRQVRRVLRDDGTCWLNLGDTYSGGGGGNYGTGKNARYGNNTYLTNVHNRNPPLPPGNLVGVPWRVALALQADGWVLRSEIPWIKRSAMPESVTNRPGKAVESVFLLAKGSGYFYDHDAVRTGTRNFRNSDLWYASAEPPHGVTENGKEIVGLDITAKGYKGCHYAVFPAKLIEPLILAGTSAHGCCARCGSPYKRVTAREKLRRERPNEHVKYAVDDARNSCGNGVAGVKVETLGWEATCGCQGAGVKPCVALDPFLGSGTVAEVCVKHGRHCVGIELNETYLSDNAIPRAQAALGEFSGRKG